MTVEIEGNVDAVSILKYIQQTGVRLWSETYAKHRDDDNFMLRHVNQIAIGRGLTQTRAEHDFATPDRPVVAIMAFAARWVDGGCRIIDADEKYFAAMAQTKVSEDSADELRIPWPAFAVRIPAGLLVAEDGNEYRLITVHSMINVEMLHWDREAVRSDVEVRNHGHACTFTLHSGSGTSLDAVWPKPLANFLFSVEEDEDTSVSDANVRQVQSDSDRRIREMARRAVVGLLYTMQHTNNWKLGSSIARPVYRLRSEPPPHRNIVIGRPLSIDVRDAVRRDARSGKHAAPSVQTLVRGHIKRQVVGLARSGRKLIWIEPYWRGPEDAPILARPYRVGPKDAEQ